MSQTNLRATESGKNKDFGCISSIPYIHQSTNLVTQEPVTKRFCHGLNQFAGSQRTMRQEKLEDLHIPICLAADVHIQMLCGIPSLSVHQEGMVK